MRTPLTQMFERDEKDSIMGGLTCYIINVWSLSEALG